MSINQIKNRIVLCGYNTFNAYGMLRSLGEAGFRPTLIINHCVHPFLAKSRYAINDVFYFNKPTELPDIIKENIPSDHLKPIIICCDDPLQSVMDLHYDEFKDEYLLSNCNQTQGEITRLMDKEIQMKIATECGVLVPKTWQIPKNGDIPADIVYPCIAKPELSIAGSKTQIRVCRKESDLRDALAQRDYLVQEFIEKDYEAIIWGTSIGNGEYYMPVVCRKLRQYPDTNSVTSFGILDPFTKHIGIKKDDILKLLNTLAYVGMFSIEFAVKDDMYHMLEVNLRNDGLQYFATAAGTNLPLIYIRSLLGLKFEKPDVKTPMFFMGETTDIQQIRRHKVSMLGWIKDLCRTKSFFIFNWRDPMPFISQFTGKIASHLK